MDTAIERARRGGPTGGFLTAGASKAISISDLTDLLMNIRNLVARLAAVAACALLLSCDRIGGRTIAVEFRDAQGLRGGESVYLAGVKIGRVTGEPSLVKGRAQVPVLLARKSKDGVPAGSVFLLTADRSEPRKQCLVAYSLGSAAPPIDGAEAIYVGVSNRAELLLMIGAEKANELWQEWTK